MDRAKITEIVQNFVMGAISLALAVFMVTYEYAAMGNYAQSSGEGGAGFAVAAIIMFIFMYIPCGVFFFALGIGLFVWAWRTYKGEKENRGGEFISNDVKKIKEKNRSTILLIVFKAIAAFVCMYFFILTLDTAYDTIVSTLVYCVIGIAYIASVVLTVIHRKKVVAITAE
ncbi:MAG: hypothetical protein IJV80_02490 [Clostridia bacterium]|nr:hypothetical protein [Clostridia bacterium]